MTPFTVLFDEDLTSSLPATLAQIYGGNWTVPAFPNRPYVYSNFVLSRDGRVSFSLPGQVGGGEVSLFNPHDQWLMGLLRARADAVIVGDGTLRLEPEHLWRCEYIFPSYAEAFLAWRSGLALQACPLQVIVSLEGDIPPHAAIFREGLEVVIATTDKGFAKASEQVGSKAKIIKIGDANGVDLPRLARLLHGDFGIQTLLCEGGPRLIGSMLAQKVLDEEFLCLSPVLIGQNLGEMPRPGLVEGTAFRPENAPQSKPIALRRAGDHLFLRSRYVYR